MSNKTSYDFSGWATRYDIKCSDERTIRKEAFVNDNGARVPLVWNHDHKDPDNILGHAILENREEGVYAYCSFNDTEKGAKAKKLVKHKDICALSIYANQLKQNGNDVIHGKIREVSLVLAGANPGAHINNVVLHSSDGNAVLNEKGEAIMNEEEAFIFNESKELIIPEEDVKHSDNDDGAQTPKKEIEEKKMAEEMKKQEEKTVQEVFDSLTEEQKTVVYALIGKAVEDAQNGELDEEEGNPNMKHNAFDHDHNDEDALMHADVLEAIEDVTKRKKFGSMKESFLAHGIENVGALFPEAKAVGAYPAVVDIENSWVSVVMNGVKHSPFSRIKSTYATLTADEARALGYVKGKQKVVEVITAAKRTTVPQTVYKLQKIDRDDVVDITDFDVVMWIKQEMRTKLDQELARAFLFGDGRNIASDDKINEINIRPVAKDDDVYTIKKALGTATSTVDQIAGLLIDSSVLAMDEYRGSGNITAFVRRDVLSQMLLLKDGVGHRLYKNVQELATAMLVNRVIAVPSSVMGEHYALLVDLSDYNVGADKGGEVNMFDDFDINYNKYEYLIETRCSGANVVPYSAIVFNKSTEVETPEEGQ